MRAFSPSLVAYFAAVSATCIRLVESAAIPRFQEDVSRDASALAGRVNTHVVVFNDGGRPRWGFVIPNGKRSSSQAPPTMPAPPKLAKPGRAKFKGKAKSSTSKDKKPSKAFSAKNPKGKTPASDSSAAHHNHSKHVPGSHHRDTRKGDTKKGGRSVAERRAKADKHHSLITVALGNGRYGHKFETNAIMWRADPSAQNSEGDGHPHNRAHARDLASERRRHSRYNSQRRRALLGARVPTYHIHGTGVADIMIPVANDVSHAIVERRAEVSKTENRHLSRAAVSAGVQGTIDIKTVLPSGDLQVKLASLVLAIDPTTNASFVMNANNNTATPVYLHVIPGAAAPSDANGDTVKVVSLRIPVFDRTEARTTDYCAQFDPVPTAPVPLTAEPCLDNSGAPANPADPALSHVSQNFAYTPSTGAVTPIWLNSVTATGGANSTSTIATKRSANCEGDGDSAAMTQFNAINGTASQTNTVANMNSNPPQAVGVMMYFEPLVNAEIYSVDPSSGGSSASAAASGSATANGGEGSSDNGDYPGSENTETESSDASDENSLGGNVNSNASVSASPPASTLATPPASTPQPTSATPAPPTSAPPSPPASPTSAPDSPSASPPAPPASGSVPAAPASGTPIVQANVVPASETPSPNSAQQGTQTPAALTVTTSPTPSSTPCSSSNTTPTSSSSGGAAAASPTPADASASYEWLFTPDGP